MKHSNKTAFSMLEVILSLMLLSIVAVFVFRYIHIFYTNYSQSKDLYYQNIDLDKALMIIQNKMELRVKGTEVASIGTNVYTLTSSHKKNSILEFIIKNKEALIGGYRDANNDRQWIGYSRIINFDANDDNSTLSTQQLAYTKLSRLSIVAKLLKTHKFKILLPNVNPRHRIQAGWYGGSSSDIINVFCRTSDCFDDNAFIIDPKNFKTFMESEAVKINKDQQRKIILYDIIDSAIAIKMEKSNKGTNNLVMYFNYKPWEKETYSNKDKNIIIKNIYSFSFKEIQNSSNIQIEICINKNNNSCKSIKINNEL